MDTRTSQTYPGQGMAITNSAIDRRLDESLGYCCFCLVM